MDSLSFFRRNLKPLMAAMTLMAMISFVFLDETMKAGTTFLVPLILAALFGGGAFVWGTRCSKQNEYGTMGGLVGAVLGLVTTKQGAIESGDEIKRRIDAAGAYVPLESLCVSPQCGFSSTHHGNAVSESEQWRKLELVVRVAGEVWGEG